MTRKRTWVIMIVGTLFSLAGFYAAGWAPLPTSLDAAANQAGLLALVTGSAVVIERVLEGFWTIMGLTLGSAWPLNVVSGFINGVNKDLNADLEPFYGTALDPLIAKYEANQPKQADELKRLKQTLQRFKELPAPDAEQFTGLKKALQYAQARVPDEQALDQLASQADLAAHFVDEFAKSFKSNPGRRLMSLLMGTYLGYFVAAVWGLDLFQIVLGQPAAAWTFIGLPHPGIAVTGLVMGLGANPTHEVIRFLEETKKAKKQEVAAG